MSLSIKDRILFIKGLRSPSTDQILLIRLHDMAVRTQHEEKLMHALIKSETARERADRAKSAADTFHRLTHQSAKQQQSKREAAERRARHKRLIELGKLFDLAGLQDKTKEDLFGLLLAGQKFATEEQWAKWRQAGAKSLAL